MSTARQIIANELAQCRYCTKPMNKFADQVFCNAECRTASKTAAIEKYHNLTAELLRGLYDYNKETGEFARKFNPLCRKKGSAKVGSINSWGYRQISIYKKLHMAHRLAWLYVYGEWPHGEIDHINHEKLDNRIANLRIVDRTVNSQNLPFKRSNSSGATGVMWDPRSGKWRARITHNKRARELGRFDTKDQAIAVRQAAERDLGFHHNHGKGAQA
jgi:hypothetical protein